MCGIAGIFHYDRTPPNKDCIAAMTRVLSHRGPDGEGIECIDGLALGHRRLSIIDLAGGAQPFWSGDRKSVISFNGEIFNYLELKRELESSGASFRTSSDTEVLLALLTKHGVSALSKINGQFALAWYDLSSKTLHLVRDRMGEKPLFIARYEKALVFASELKAIALYERINGISSKLNLQALDGFLSLNYVPDHKSFLGNVRQLPPANYLRIKGDALYQEKYWNPEVGLEIADEQEALSIYEELVFDAARLRARSDVPIGVFLSGGVDSASVAVALKKSGANTTAFSADFSDQRFSEIERAKSVAKALGFKHRVIPIEFRNNQAADLIPHLLFHGDTPLADSSALAVYLLSRETSKEVKVVLSGDGADELFGGYLTHQATLIRSKLPGTWPTLSGALYEIARAFPRAATKVGFFEQAERFLRGFAHRTGAAHFAWNGMFDLDEKAAILGEDSEAARSLRDTFQQCAELLGVGNSDNPSLQAILKADQLSYLPLDILAKTDGMSMAHGLEVRPLFTDHRLVEFARRLHPKLLLERRGVRFSGKILMKKWLEKQHVPLSAEDRKQGFSIPVHSLFRGDLKEFFGDLINAQFVRSHTPYNQTKLNALFKDHLRKRRHIGFELWGIMMSLVWIKIFMIDRPESWPVNRSV